MRRFLPAIAFAAAQAAASAAPVLNTIVPCPATAACLYANMFEGASREKSATMITGPEGLEIFLTMQGRLNGGAPTLYAVNVFNASWGQLPRVAYLGRSPANNPLIQTDRGVLEIMDADQDLPLSDYYVVDTVQWKVIDRYLQLSYSDILIFTKGGPATMWDDERKLCVSAPVKRPGPLQILPRGCAARPKKPDSWAVQGDVAPEALQLARIKQLFPALVSDEMGPPAKADTSFEDSERGIAFFRIKGTPNVVVVSYYTREG